MSERIDVLDSAGRPTGVTKEKDAVHRDGDLHRAAHVWIATRDGRVLLQRRADVKENYPGLWDVSCAGHLSAGESAIDAAVREAAEEIGVALDPRELVHVATLFESCVLNGGAYHDHEVHEVFVVVRDAIDPASLALQAEEVAELRLVPVGTLADVDDTFVPHGAEYELVMQWVRGRLDAPPPDGITGRSS